MKTMKVPSTQHLILTAALPKVIVDWETFHREKQEHTMIENSSSALETIFQIIFYQSSISKHARVLLSCQIFASLSSYSLYSTYKNLT
jgi:hypothetical protein